MNYNLNMNVNTDMVKFDKMPPRAFMIGLLSAFDNRFQTCADKFFKYHHTEKDKKYDLEDHLKTIRMTGMNWWKNTKVVK